MPEVNLAELRAEMEAEREWRQTEMRLLSNQIGLIPSEEQRKTARKPLVVMLYAHFEGVSKTLLSIYVGKLNSLGLRVDEVVPPLGAASLAEVFHALRDPNKKCAEFARALPDDTELHRFARDRDFVEVAWRVAERSVRIDTDKIVDTESNLKPIVLRKILFRLGLDSNLAQPWDRTIHQLLNQRNNIAHGSARDGIEERTYQDLELAVWHVVDGIVRAIYDAAKHKMYLLMPPPGETAPSRAEMPV